MRSDDAMRQCVNKAEEHINTLLKENQHLCEEYRRLYSDYCLLEEQNQSVRHAVNSRQTGGSYTSSKGGQEVHNEVSAQIPVFPTFSCAFSFQLKNYN